MRGVASLALRAASRTRTSVLTLIALFALGGGIAAAVISGSGHLAPQAPRPHSGDSGMVVSASGIASEVGAQVLRDGGNAIDAADRDRLRARRHASNGGQHRRRRLHGDSLPRRPARPRSTSRRRRRWPPMPRCSSTRPASTSETQHNSHIAVGVPGHGRGVLEDARRVRLDRVAACCPDNVPHEARIRNRLRRFASTTAW